MIRNYDLLYKMKAIGVAMNLNNPTSREKHNAINRDVQKILRERVDQLGLPDSEVARLSNLPQATVYRLLNAKTTSPSFSLIYLVSKAIGIPLPLSESSDALVASINFYIGPKELSTHNKQIDILPEQEDKLIAEVTDDSTNRRYPKGSILFITPIGKYNRKISQGDELLVSITKSNGDIDYRAMIVSKSPEADHWILYHMSDNSAHQVIYSIHKDSLQGFFRQQCIKTMGKVFKAQY